MEYVSRESVTFIEVQLGKVLACGMARAQACSCVVVEML